MYKGEGKKTNLQNNGYNTLPLELVSFLDRKKCLYFYCLYLCKETLEESLRG